MADPLGEPLLARLVRGDLDPHLALAALRERSRDAATDGAADGSLPGLLAQLAGQPGPAARTLLNRLCQLRAEAALRVHRARQGGQAPAVADLADLADLPLFAVQPWSSEWRPARRTSAAALERWRTLRMDLRWATTHAGEVPALEPLVAVALAEEQRMLAGLPWPLELDPQDAVLRLPAELATVVAGLLAAQRAAPPPGSALELAALRARLASAGAGADGAAVDRLLAWDDDRAGPLLATLLDDPRHAERVIATMLVRCGPRSAGSAGWRTFLEGVPGALALPAMAPAELALAWCLVHGQGDDLLHAALARVAEPAAVADDVVLARWHGRLAEAAPRAAVVPPDQVAISAPVPPLDAVVGEAPVNAPAAPLRTPLPPRPAAPALAPAPAPAPRLVPPEPEAPRWWRHLHGFLGDNWYLVAGILLMVGGLSLLAYYTWDKHWLVRYTIMPLLLAAFTGALGKLGGWLERRDPLLAPTAAWLRGAALALFPVNAMTVVLMAGDPAVGAKPLALGAALAAYLGAGWFAARRWCAAVHPALGGALAPALVFLAALVTAVPLLRWALGDAADPGPEAGPASAADPSATLVGLVAVVHLGFVVAAGVGLHLARRVLTAELVAARRVPWFAGATLAVVGLESAAWITGALGVAAPTWVWGPLAILAGALVLRVERLLDEGRPESFLGYGLVLLGVAFGAGQPEMRIACLALAGAVWLRHAAGRAPAPATALLHAWIGCLLLTLAGAACALLPEVGHGWWPWIGLALAGVTALAGGWARRAAADGAVATVALATALAGLRQALLPPTVVLAVLVQWHDRSEPLATAGLLLVAAALLACAAGGGMGGVWLRTVLTIAVLALAVPYLGGADMSGHALHGNRMVAGLALLGGLWLAACAIARRRGAADASMAETSFAAARSAVLWGLGVLALGAMVLRVMVEDAPAAAGPLPQLVIDQLGPLAMGGLLLATAWWSRSLLPALLAVAMLVVLLPELRAGVAAHLDADWNQRLRTGLGSAIAGLALALACFPLRTAAWLRDLAPGDRLTPGRDFPLVRRDARLLTVPALCAATFLAAKTPTVVLLRALPDPPTATLVAVLLAGATWLALVAWWRRGAPLAIIGWLLIGLAGGWLWADVVDPGSGRHDQVLAVFLLSMQLGWLGLAAAGRWRGWDLAVLAGPTRGLLNTVTVALVALITLTGWAGWERSAPWTLATVLLALSVWRALAGSRLHGWLVHLQVLTAVMALSLDRPLAQLADHAALIPLLAVGLAWQALSLLARCWRTAAAWSATPLASPLRLLAPVAAVVLPLLVGRWALSDGPYPLELLLAPVLVLLAVASGGGGPLLLGLALLVPVLAAGASQPTTWLRLESLTTPWHLALWAAVVAAAGQLAARRPALAATAGVWRELPGGAGWLRWPALAAVPLALLVHVAVPVWRHAPEQLVTAPLAALAAVLVAASPPAWPAALLATVAALVVGGVLAVRELAGPALLAWGVHDLHQVCLGLLAALAVVALPWPFARLGFASVGEEAGGEAATAVAAGRRRCGLVLAWGILALLALNWLVAHDLAAMSNGRFIVSAALALAVSMWFRAARAGTAHPAWTSAGQLAGLAVALWSLTLLLPWLRQPAWVLLALAVPAAWFHLRAETVPPTAAAWRAGAGALAGLILASWVARPVFQVVVFPGVPADTATYHGNALLALLAGLALLRQHALSSPSPGQAGQRAFHGGLGMILGTYFLITWPPALSPFHAPAAAAWCALALAHALLLAAARASWFGDLGRALSGCDAGGWLALRRAWGTALAWLAAVAVAWGLTLADDARDRAPLLLGLATVLAHLGWVRAGRGWLAAAGLLALVALHLDALTPSWLPLDAVAWVLLGGWAGLALAGHLRPAAAPPPALLGGVRPERLGLGLGALALAHLVLHPPWTAAGLTLVALAAAVLLLTPRTALPPDARGRTLVLLPLLAPPWLAFWGWCGTADQPGMPTLDALLALAVALAVEAVLPVLAAVRQALVARSAARASLLARPVVADQTLALLAEHGARLADGLRAAATGLALVVVVGHATATWPAAGFAALVALCLLLGWSWCMEAVARASLAAAIAAQLCGALLLFALRQQLALGVDWWTAEYDVWAALVLTLALAAARPLLVAPASVLARSLAPTVLLLPLASLLYTVFNGLGSDLALVVLGTQSLLATWLGRDDRESPLHVLALLGAAAFLVVLLVARLGLDAAPAYGVPVGAALLALVQLRARRLAPGSRALVRCLALVLMLGSAAWAALFDPRHPLGFNLVLLALCFASMVIGTVLRLRLALVVGFAGLAIDLGVTVVRLLAGAERSLQMSVIGGLALVFGALLVGGAAYIQANRAAVRARLEGLKARWSEWE